MPGQGKVAWHGPQDTLIRTSAPLYTDSKLQGVLCPTKKFCARQMLACLHAGKPIVIARHRP